MSVCNGNVDLNAGHPERLYEGEDEVSGDGSAHEAAPVIVPQDAGGDEQAAGVGPRDHAVLRPPPRYHDAGHSK